MKRAAQFISLFATMFPQFSATVQAGIVVSLVFVFAGLNNQERHAGDIVRKVISDVE